MVKAKFERAAPTEYFGTIGHVDHGKTALAMALTKMLAMQNVRVIPEHRPITIGIDYSRGYEWERRAKRLLITHSAHTPKPEVMFASMLKAGTAKLIRRRHQPPLLVPVWPRRGRR